jgi:4-hydroxy-tetrahydrodipicolinate synthase
MMLTGVYVPLVTPFDADGAVDFGALAALAEEVLDAGASGIVALGTTGEPASLSADEQQGIVDVLAKVCGEREAPLLVGASSHQALNMLCSRPEVTAALCPVPSFVRPGEAGVIAHFAALAAASPVPLVAYHIPYRTGQQLSADSLRHLADIPGVIGIKYAVGGIDADTIALLADPPTDFAVLCGDDLFISPLLALGAQGGILASAQFATARFAELVDAWQAGDAVRGRELGRRLAPMSSAIFAEPNPTVLKAVLHARGRIPSATVRLPLLPASSKATQAALEQVALLAEA